MIVFNCVAVYERKIGTYHWQLVRPVLEHTGYTDARADDWRVLSKKEDLQ